MDSLFGLDHAALKDKELALLTTVYDPTSLAIYSGILQDAEIPFLVKERGSGGITKVIAGYSMFGSDIFVPRAVLDTARNLIEPPDDVADESPEDSEKGKENC